MFIEIGTSSSTDANKVFVEGNQTLLKLSSRGESNSEIQLKNETTSGKEQSIKQQNNEWQPVENAVEESSKSVETSNQPNENSQTERSTLSKSGEVRLSY